MTRSKKNILVVLVPAILLFGCSKKKYNDALPKVQFTSATAYGPDSLVLQGQVTNIGAAEIDYTGFSFSQNPSSSIINGQILLKGTSGAFYAVVAGVPDSTYYIKAFAANRFGYTQTGTTTFVVPSAAPATAPCSLTNNQVNDNGSTFGVSTYGSASNPQYGGYTVWLYGPTEDISISFPTAPYNGVYTTTSDGSNLTGRQAIVSISHFNQYIVNSGGSIYVAVNSSGVTTVSTCGLTYSIGSGTATIKGKASY